MEKREAILVAALKLFVEYGFHGTPTSKIASEAGVSNGALFNYFKTKDELVIALYVKIKEELNAQLLINQKGNDIVGRMKCIFVDSINWSLENKDAWYFIQQFHFSPHLGLVSKEEIEKQTQMHQDLMEDALRAGILVSLPVELIGTMMGSQIYGLHQYLLTADVSIAKSQKLIDASFERLLKMILKE
jgi:AcrR family transcriptional regulator